MRMVPSLQYMLFLQFFPAVGTRCAGVALKSLSLASTMIASSQELEVIKMVGAIRLAPKNVLAKIFRNVHC